MPIYEQKRFLLLDKSSVRTTLLIVATYNTFKLTPNLEYKYYIHHITRQHFTSNADNNFHSSAKIIFF